METEVFRFSVSINQTLWKQHKPNKHWAAFEMPLPPNIYTQYILGQYNLLLDAVMIAEQQLLNADCVPHVDKAADEKPCIG